MPNNPTIQELSASIASNTLHTTVDNFIAHQGKIEYITGAEHSAFIRGASENGYVLSGIVRINTDEIKKISEKEGTNELKALQSVFVHEIGHVANATADAHNIATTPAALEQYCYTREGEATAYAFNVALEVHRTGANLPVSGVSGSPDLYYNMYATYLSFSATLDPRSTVFQSYMLNYATAQFASDPQYQAACKAFASDPTRATLYLPPDDYAPSGEVGSAGGDNYTDPEGDYADYPGYGPDDGGFGAGCVSIFSILPGGRLAGDILVGDEMELADERTLEAGSGIVSYSKVKFAAGFRITTASGAALVCSDTAPIPTPEGLILAPELHGKNVAVRKDHGENSTVFWDVVISVDSIGEIQVQHITVGDKCFWAGEHQGTYILHHNQKGEGGNDAPGDEDTGNSISPLNLISRVGSINGENRTIVNETIESSFNGLVLSTPVEVVVIGQPHYTEHM